MIRWSYISTKKNTTIFGSFFAEHFLKKTLTTHLLQRNTNSVFFLLDKLVTEVLPTKSVGYFSFKNLLIVNTTFFSFLGTYALPMVLLSLLAY